MSRDNYDNMSKTVKDVTKVVAGKMVADAAKEVKVKMKSSSKACWQPVTKIKEKKLGVTKRLTNSKIDILQNYFGIALIQNIIWRI